MTRPPYVVKAVDRGYGDGSGFGSGDGWDYGSGYGSGSGNGYGSGRGNGSGSGETVRWLDTSHPYYTAEWCKLQGGAAPYKVLP